MRSWRTSPATAWEHPLVEWARTATSYCSIVLDCDSRESQELACAVEAGYGDLPRPNVAAQRASSGHLHLGWNLRTPVHRGATARPRPLAALGRIAEYYAVTLRSDCGYVGVLAYNPVHSDYATVYPRSEPYDLAELARALPAHWRRPARAADLVSAPGRNCHLFAALCKLATRGSDEGLLTWARTLNSEFAVPLPESEVRGIWRSVCRYRARWRVQGHQQAFLFRQAARGRNGGTASGLVRRAGSLTERQPWADLGVSRAPWLAVRARAIAEHLDHQSNSARHTRILTDPRRLASVQLGNGSPLFGVTAADDHYAIPHPIAAGWERLWDTVRAVSATFVTIDPINLAAVWTGYGASEVGAFMGAIRDELGSLAGALLVGHTGKAAATSDEPSALDILGSGAWSHRARGCFVARAIGGHYELHLVKANYAPKGTWAYTATSAGALALVDIRAEQCAEDAEFDAAVLKAVPAHPDTISPSKLATLVCGGRNGKRKPAVDAALERLMAAGSVTTNAKGNRWSTPTTGEEKS